MASLQARVSRPLDETNQVELDLRQKHKRLLHKLQREQASSRKRPARALRRPNPKSLLQVEKALSELLLQECAKQDGVTHVAFFKAQAASVLGVPEHFIDQVAHRWNRKGLCSQAQDRAPHDSHRERMWGNFWTSAWQDSRYEVDLSKLQHACP
jgi:phosphomevalonate kinase